MTIGKRLKEEREALGMTQVAFREACGVSKVAQFNFENDRQIPGGAYLAAADALGVDIRYVLTGRRAALRSGLDDVRVAASTSGTTLSDRDRLEAAISAVEQGLAETRRSLPPDKRTELILAAFDLMAEPEQSRSNVIRMVRAAA